MPRVYPGHDVEFFRDRLEQAIRRYGMPPAAPRYWGWSLDREASAALGYMQPRAALYWQQHLYRALVAHGVCDRPDIFAITIVDQRWHFGQHAWNFQPGKIRYQVRRALKGLNYPVMLEFQVFGNFRYHQMVRVNGIEQIRDHGRTIAPHIQGLLWGKKPSRRQRAAFPGGLLGAPGIKLVRLTDFAGAVRYMVKPPMGQLVYSLPGGGFLRYPWARMALPLHHLFLTHLCNTAYPDLAFASGEGSAVLSHAKRSWRGP